MASFSLFLKPSVEKDLGRLTEPVLTRIWQKIEALADEPLPRQSTKLAGTVHLYRLRVGDYRVIYTVDRPAKHVIVH